MHKSTITINVEMDENRVPEAITWEATDAAGEREHKAKAMMLAFWDGADKTALRIDLWTKSMMVDEMGDFVYQTMMTMADSYGRATNHTDMVEDMKAFSREFYRKFREKLKENQASR